MESYLVDFNWSHRFNANWTLRNGFVGQFVRLDSRVVSRNFVLADDRTLDRFTFFGPTTYEQYQVFVDFTGDFQLLGMEHKVLLGADYYEIGDSEGDLFFDSAGLFLAPIDLFNPVYGQVDLAAIQSQPPDFFERFNQSWYGLYFQDQITLWDKVHILGGGRYNWAETGFGSSSTAAEAEMRLQQNELAEDAFSPRVGLVYQPWLSLYGNYCSVP
ncbi:MAG: TonB-dependent receptor domain-containing protein [Gammaproteobacteria bacterium]